MNVLVCVRAEWRLHVFEFNIQFYSTHVSMVSHQVSHNIQVRTKYGTMYMLTQFVCCVPDSTIYRRVTRYTLCIAFFRVRIMHTYTLTMPKVLHTLQYSAGNFCMHTTTNSLFSITFDFLLALYCCRTHWEGEVHVRIPADALLSCVV